MRDWLIRLLGGYTFKDAVEKADRSFKAAEHSLNVKYHGKALDALNKAYDIEMSLLGEHRYHGVEKKALDSFQRNLVARLREGFGLDGRITDLSVAKLTSGTLTVNSSPNASIIKPQAKIEFVQPQISDNVARYTNGVAQ